jgi:Arc/MetJ family transcription regulator
MTVESDTPRLRASASRVSSDARFAATVVRRISESATWCMIHDSIIALHALECTTHRVTRCPTYGYILIVPSAKPRIQVTIDDDLASAVAEFGAGKPRSSAVHDLALRGADAIRAEKEQLQEGLEFLRRLDAGEEDRFDFSISTRLHAER